jgi:hypothetical protein
MDSELLQILKDNLLPDLVYIIDEYLYGDVKSHFEIHKKLYKANRNFLISRWSVADLRKQSPKKFVHLLRSSSVESVIWIPKYLMWNRKLIRRKEYLTIRYIAQVAFFKPHCELYNKRDFAYGKDFKLYNFLDRQIRDLELEFIKLYPQR